MKYIYNLLLILALPITSSTVIYTSSYVDVINGTVVNNSSIKIDNGLITDIKTGYIKLTKDDNLIDLRGQTLMPGFMDMHVHFGGEYQSKAQRPVKTERETEAILATAHALTTLKAGFTTVRQVGDSGLIAITLRDAINAGYVNGTRFLSTGKSI